MTEANPTMLLMWLPRSRVREEVLDQAEALREGGDFTGAVSLLVDHDDLPTDQAALCSLALAHLALRDRKAALEAIRQAANRVEFEMRVLRFNRTTLVDNVGEDAAAIAQALAAATAAVARSDNGFANTPVPTAPRLPASSREFPTRVRRLEWISSNRVRRRQHRVSPELLDEAESLFGNGDFQAVVHLLFRAEHLDRDQAALCGLALAHLGANDPQAALAALDKAGARARFEAWALEINRTKILKDDGQFAAASAAAQRAVEIRPDAPVGYLTSIAVAECAGPDPDRQLVRDLVREMDIHAPDWRDEDDVVRDLLLDTDYMALRRDEHLFESVFNISIHEARERNSTHRPKGGSKMQR